MLCKYTTDRAKIIGGKKSGKKKTFEKRVQKKDKVAKLRNEVDQLF